MSYRNTEVWQLARTLSVQIHRMSLTESPRFEMFEEGSQIRRASKSIRSNMVEGYGRRRYKAEYVRFLVFAHASCDETIDHLDTLFETGSLKNEDLYARLRDGLDTLGRKLNRFIQVVEREHVTPVPSTPTTVTRRDNRNSNPVSRISNRP